MLKDIIFLLLIGYVVYKVLTRFILPILNVTTAANNHMRKMQDQMNAQMQHQNRQGSHPDQKKKAEKEGDYIDYEEVK